MPNSLIVIVGGAFFDSGINDYFIEKNLIVEHYNARKSSDLKKQTVPKNTIGVIITVDRSHMAFGSSNELTRNLKNNNIPFVFSSGNQASFNAAKILFQKISRQFPELIKLTASISEKEKKLEFYKQEWEEHQKKVLDYIGEWLDILSQWNKSHKIWESILDNWKLHVLDWKEIQSFDSKKEIKKKLNREFTYLINWKTEIHDYGIKLESKLNILKEWKADIENSCNDLINTEQKLNERIKKINDLNIKTEKNDFKNWRTEFLPWSEELELWKKEFNDWHSVFPDLYEKVSDWEKEIKLWRSNLDRNLL